jgi:hypothetical protein
MIDALHWLGTASDTELASLQHPLMVIYIFMGLVWVALIDLGRRGYQGPTFL